MKKILIVFIIIMSIFFISCSNDQETVIEPQKNITEPIIIIEEKTVQEPAPTIEEIKTQETIPAQPAQEITQPLMQPATQPTPAVATLDPRIQSILTKQSKIKNIQFMYVPPTEVTQGHMYYYRAPYWKIEIKQPYEVRNWENYFETVFMDDTEKKAEGYCWKQKLCLNKTFTVDYNQYRVKNPMEWNSAITSDAIWIGTQQFDKRSVIHISMNDGKTSILIDETYGIPLLIEYDIGEDKPKERHQYKSISVNSVKESDVKEPAT